MKKYSPYLLIVANLLLLYGIARADAPRQINKDIFGEVWGAIGWAWSRLEKGVSAAADHQEKRLATIKGENQSEEPMACEPEFDPVPLSEVKTLSKKRTITDIKRKLGTPCQEDDEYIYYPTDTGEIIRFNKKTAAGSFAPVQR